MSLDVSICGFGHVSETELPLVSMVAGCIEVCVCIIYIYEGQGTRPSQFTPLKMAHLKIIEHFDELLWLFPKV